jgi:predicted Zn-dependent peptidase
MKGKTLYDPFAPFKKTILDNGLTIFSNEQDRPFVYVDFIIHAGGREDPRGKEGVAHFLEHLVSCNIPGYPNIQANERFFKDTGGHVNFGGTGYLDTHYGFCLPVKKGLLKKAFSIFSAMLIGSKIRKHIEKERAIITGELWRSQTNRKILKIKNTLPRMLLGDHRQARSSVLGLPETISAMSYSDMQEFYDRYYIPRNISIVCTGGIKEQDLMALIKSTSFARELGGKRNPAFIKRNPPRILVPEKKLLQIRGKDIGRRMEVIEYESFWVLPPHINDDALDVARCAINDKLFQEIREKHKLTYEIHARVDRYQDHYTLSITGQINKRAKNTIDGIVMSTISSLKKYRTSLKNMVERQKKQILFSDLDLESINDIASSNVSRLGYVQTSADDLRRLRKLKSKDFDEIFESLLGESRAALIVTP